MSDPSAFANFNAAMSLTNHVYFNPIIGALARSGVPDHLDKGPLPASDLAQLARMDSVSLTRALRALAAFGAFKEVSPGVFANNPVSELFRNRPGTIRNWAIHTSSDHFLKSAAALGHSVVTGKSATTHVFGESFWDYMRKHPEENETFNRGLAELRGDEHQQVADAYDWTGVSTVVDVGGGVGSLLAAILAKRPAMRGVLIEQSELIPDADRASPEERSRGDGAKRDAVLLALAEANLHNDGVNGDAERPHSDDPLRRAGAGAAGDGGGLRQGRRGRRHRRPRDRQRPRRRGRRRRLRHRPPRGEEAGEAREEGAGEAIERRGQRLVEKRREREPLLGQQLELGQERQQRAALRTGLRPSRDGIALAPAPLGRCRMCG